MQAFKPRRAAGWALGALALGVLAVAAVSCGGGGSSDNTATSSAGGATAPAAAPTTAPGGAATVASGGSTSEPTVKIATAGSLGMILTDAQGMTLYTFKPDVANSGKSAASEAQIQAWPPLDVTGAPVKPDGLSGDLGTFDYEGKQWVTYKGLPLYHFVQDKAPGDTKGQGLAGVWFVATP